MRSNFQQIVLYCLGLYTHKPGLREVDLEPRPKKGDDKIKIQKQRRNTQKKASHIVQAELIWILGLREVDLKTSDQRGTTRARALMNFY